MKRRYREILNIILNTEECITGNELAKLCEVSLRTIRQDIKEINILLKEYNMKIDSSVKKGYYLSKENKDILKKNNIIREVLDYEYITETPNSPIDRQVYILLKLIINNCISEDQLAESLYVSTSTINNDIGVINRWLKKNFNLSMSYSLNDGIKLKAEEREKRNIISWVLAMKTNISTISKYWNYLFEETDVINKARELYHIVCAETRKYNYYLSGHSFQLFCYEILVAVKRSQSGFNLKDSDIVNGKLIPVIIKIRKTVKKELGINLSEMEWLNLQQHFKSKQFLHGTDIADYESGDAGVIVDRFLKALNDKFNIDLSVNPINKSKLILYIGPMINRLKYRHCISNKISEKVIKTYKTEFKMASEIEYIIKEKLNLNTNLIELAYITFHLVSMRRSGNYKLNTVIVCDYDESILSFIKYKVNNHFGEKINIFKVYEYQEFMFENKEKLKDIEFIITTSTIADITNIPFIKITPEVEQNDIEMITEYIDNNKRKE